MEIVELVLWYCDCGVVGFDIVGFEVGFLVIWFCDVFDLFVCECFLVMVYVGEVDGVESICGVLVDGYVL